MLSKYLLMSILVCFIHHLCTAQSTVLDSCGIDSNPILNQYEISILDSLFFSSYNSKKNIKTDFKNGFDFKGKKIAFYSCSKNSNTKGNRLLTKKDFFNLCQPDFKGHAGRGMIIFNEGEINESKGYDAVILIDCPYPQKNQKNLIMQLIKASE